MHSTCPNYIAFTCNLKYCCSKHEVLHFAGADLHLESDGFEVLDPVPHRKSMGDNQKGKKERAFVAICTNSI